MKQKKKGKVWSLETISGQRSKTKAHPLLQFTPMFD
jgi:hypothetical protein